MNKRVGRPFSENPKDTRIFVRLDKDTLTVLDSCADVLKTSRSDIVRQGISLVKEKIDEK